MNLWPYLTGLDNFETKGISERICQYDVRDSCSNNITRSIKTADNVHFGLTKGCHCYEIFYFKKIIALANLSKVCFITLIWLFIIFCANHFAIFYQKNMFIPHYVCTMSRYTNTIPLCHCSPYISISTERNICIFILWQLSIHFI